MLDKIQILGLSEYYPAVLFDILKEFGFQEFNIFPNLESNTKPFLPVENYAYILNNVGKALDKNSAIIFGVSGPKNKIPVFRYFEENQFLSFENLTTMVHDSVYVAPSCKIGKGVFIEQNSTIASQTFLGNCVSIKRGANIGHHCVINDWTDINPGVIISGRVTVGEATIIGSGATIIDGISIGRNTLIGAGSLVTKDIPSGVIAYGNPCRVIKNNDKWNF